MPQVLFASTRFMVVLVRELVFRTLETARTRLFVGPLRDSCALADCNSCVVTGARKVRDARREPIQVESPMNLALPQTTPTAPSRAPPASQRCSAASRVTFARELLCPEFNIAGRCRPLGGSPSAGAEAPMHEQDCTEPGKNQVRGPRQPTPVLAGTPEAHRMKRFYVGATSAFVSLLRTRDMIRDLTWFCHCVCHNFPLPYFSV